MISIGTDARCKAVLLLVASALLLAGCGGGGGSSQDAGTQAIFTVTSSPQTAMSMATGAKTITNDLGDTIVLEKAYFVLSNINMETDCSGSSFSVSIEKLLNGIIPSAHAHTEATPTSTGIPVVVNLLAEDNVMLNLGELSPPVGDYCGLTLSLDVADTDAENLPQGTDEPDMIGRSLYLEGTENGNPFTFSVGVAMIERKLMFNALMILDAANLNSAATIEINYDIWFDGLDPSDLDDTDLNSSASIQLLQNITASLHQL